jgi:hypothetical protein
MKSLAAVFVGMAALAASAPVSAHHSFAMFDRNKQATIKGTVKEFQWTNPHVWVQVMVPNSSGVSEEWSIEAGSPNMLYRQGWDNTTFKVGDQITLVINPLHSGGRGGNFVAATLPGGKMVGNLNARAPG